MRARGKFSKDGPALQRFFVEFLVFLGIADVDASAQYADDRTISGQRALVADRIDAARHAADDHQAPRRQVTPEAFRHLRTI